MAGAVKPNKRPYHAPRRAAAAAQTREAILRAAKDRFEAGGWAGTTIAAIAADAEVSPKTIEALFATKPALLAAVVDYSIRGDASDVPMLGRESAQAVERAPDATTMLERHVEHAIPITSRSARIASVIESAAGSDERIAELWARMTHNRRFGARWAAQTLLKKPGARSDLTLEEAQRIFIIAIDWATYRTLHGELGLNHTQLQEWMRRYYQRMFLNQPHE
ncbi:MAG: TetR family transcriptional regulator [Acetobacteraceae bacterium]|nr:TetR family transcriptional regulator [Acetobacteraceae bacterium]